MNLISSQNDKPNSFALILLCGVLSIPGLLLAPPARSAGYIQSLGEEIQIPSPEGWLLISDSIQFPFQFVHADPTAEFLIFKSTIEQDDLIRNESDLHLSVDVVIEDVLLDLPDARVTTSSGFYDGFRTGFVIEFTSTDSSSGDPLMHRFCGYIYRHSEGHQLLFTLWAKSLQVEYDLVQADITLMQDGFRYDGPQQDEVFVKTSLPLMRLAVLLVLFTVLFYLIRRRRTRSAEIERYSDNRYWRCKCGRINRTTIATCRQCGRRSPTASDSLEFDPDALDRVEGDRPDDQS